jgi:hypothetical protein
MSIGSVSAGACDGEGLDTVNPLDDRLNVIMATSAFSFRLVPGGIRVIHSHRLCKLCCVGTKLLFVNGSGRVDYESLHTRGAVPDRVGDEGKTRGHLPVDDIAFGAARCMWSLAREDAEHIPIERNMLANLVRWEILARIGDERIDGAIELILSTVPVQAIVLIFVADQLLSELLR